MRKCITGSRVCSSSRTLKRSVWRFRPEKPSCSAVLQDRHFDSNNQLAFHSGSPMDMMDGFLGDRVLVNGLPEPTLDADAGWHRVRLLNGSNARIYKLAWSRSVPMVVIGGDGGLLERPMVQRTLTLGPGQRADLLVDLSGLASGTEIGLESQAFPEGDAATTMGAMRGMRGRMGATRRALPNGASLHVMTLGFAAGKVPRSACPSGCRRSTRRGPCDQEFPCDG